MDTPKMNYFYATQAKDLAWEIFPTGHSMRVSFVIESVKNGVPSEHIINCCRWQNDQMLQLYKNNHLEHTEFGSSYKVTITNENPHAVPQRTWESGSTADIPSILEPDTPDLPKKLKVESTIPATAKLTTQKQQTVAIKEETTTVKNTAPETEKDGSPKPEMAKIEPGPSTSHEAEGTSIRPKCYCAKKYSK